MLYPVVTIATWWCPLFPCCYKNKEIYSAFPECSNNTFICGKIYSCTTIYTTLTFIVIRDGQNSLGLTVPTSRQSVLSPFVLAKGVWFSSSMVALAMEELNIHIASMQPARNVRCIGSEITIMKHYLYCRNIRGNQDKTSFFKYRQVTSGVNCRRPITLSFILLVLQKHPFSLLKYGQVTPCVESSEPIHL